MAKHPDTIELIRRREQTCAVARALLIQAEELIEERMMLLEQRDEILGGVMNASFGIVRTLSHGVAIGR